jgi:hypothetical protein
MIQLIIQDLTALSQVICWPIVVLTVLLIFHQPLSRFLEELGRRATKVSAFDISIEFARAPSPPAPWSDPALYDSSNLIGGYVTSTTIMELFQRIRDETRWHYLIVDIQAGKRWLISRLYLFTVILRHMYGLRCVVFAETKGEYARRLLGIATPEQVQLALANKYAWLEEVLVEALLDQKITVLTEPLPKDKAQATVNRFIEDERIQQGQDPQDPEWEQLGDQPIWEHTKWLNLERVNEGLRGVFFDQDASQFVDSPDISTSERNQALLRRRAPFVALVNTKGEFKGLIDRQALLERVAERIGTE